VNCDFIFIIILQTEQFTVLWVLFTVIVVGNSAVLVTLFLNKNRKSRMNFFIKQLAIAGEFIFIYIYDFVIYLLFEIYFYLNEEIILN